MKRRDMSAVKLFTVLLAVLLVGFVAPVNGEEEYDEDTYGPAAPIVWTKPLKAVEFNHKIHTMEAGLSCDSCHDSVFEMAAGTAEENADFTMESLYNGKYCGTCHDGETAFASNTRCASCHIGVRGFNKMNKAAGAEQEGGHH